MEKSFVRGFFLWKKAARDGRPLLYPEICYYEYYIDEIFPSVTNA